MPAATPTAKLPTATPLATPTAIPTARPGAVRAFMRPPCQRPTSTQTVRWQSSRRSTTARMDVASIDRPPGHRRRSRERTGLLENSVRIENRSQLIYLLTEAAELEHGIMC